MRPAACLGTKVSFRAELAAALCDRAKPPLCSNLGFSDAKKLGFLSHPGFEDDQSGAKNTCPTATETREDGKTDPQ